MSRTRGGKEDREVKDYFDWQRKYFPEGKATDLFVATGYFFPFAVVHVLKQCGMTSRARTSCVRQQIYRMFLSRFCYQGSLSIPVRPITSQLSNCVKSDSLAPVGNLWNSGGEGRQPGSSPCEHSAISSQARVIAAVDVSRDCIGLRGPYTQLSHRQLSLGISSVLLFN